MDSFIWYRKYKNSMRTASKIVKKCLGFMRNNINDSNYI